MAEGRCSAFLTVALLVVSAAVVVQAADHIVGGDKGWSKPNGNTLSDAYLQDWTKGITFTEGDNLIFNYGPAAHNVMIVKEADYNTCNVAAPIMKYTTGADTIKIPAGTTYYICGTPTHCTSGQKVTITAVAAKTSAAAGNAVTLFQVVAAAAVAMVATIALW